MDADHDHERPAIIISANPNSGASDRANLVQQAADALEQSGFETLTLTDVDQVQFECSRLQTEGRLKAVVAAGGDGTVSLLANRLPPGTPLAVFPLGTENLLALYLGLTRSVDQLVDLIKTGQFRKMDVGRANGKLFLVTASCGFDADVVQRAHRARTGHIHRLSYIQPILHSLREYAFPKLDIQLDGQPLFFKNGTESCARWLFLFNVPRYAMGLNFVPSADPGDGLLDLCTFQQGGLLKGLGYLISVVLGKHGRWCKTEFRKFRKLRVSSEVPVPYQLDGDPGGQLPLEIEIIPAYLNILMPAPNPATDAAHE